MRRAEEEESLLEPSQRQGAVGDGDHRELVAGELLETHANAKWTHRFLCRLN